MINVTTGISNIIPPQNKGDAGIDIIASNNPLINGDPCARGWYKSITYIEYDTNIRLSHVEPYEKYALIFPRSSISKYNLSLANSVGVIDSGYENSIKLRFKYIFQPEDLRVISEDKDSCLACCIHPHKIYRKGDKIGQIIFFDHQDHARLSFMNELTKQNKNRGQGGFGSTGK